MIQHSTRRNFAAISFGSILVVLASITSVYFLSYLIIKPYVPYTEVVLCNGEEIARVTAQSKLSAAHPHVDGNWVVWYKGKTRIQFLISHCQSVVIRLMPVIE